MPSFTIRIVLHDASWDDYVKMYEHLAGYGIEDIIRSDEGSRYKMPPAEYNYIGNATRSQLLEIAKQCAAKVVRSYSVLITESAGRRWHGLEEI